MSTTNGPPDGGWGWMCVLGKFYCYFCFFGMPSAFGVIYLELIDYFNTTRELAAWIGSLSFGVTFLASPISSVLISRFGLQKTTAAGSLIAFSGCFISWFATGIPYLYVSYGVIMGIGFGLIAVPCNLIVVQYFKARIGLANSIGSVGNGLATLVLPQLYTYLINVYGWRGTLLINSGIILNGLVCAVIFMPPPYIRNATKSSKKGNFFNSCHKPEFLCKVYFLLNMATMAFGLFGYIIPFVHLPDLAVQMGIDKAQAATLVSIMGASGIVGRIVFGWISDCKCSNAIFLQGFSLLVCGAVTAVCPLLTEFYALAVYSVLYGTFIGVFLALQPSVVVMLVGLDDFGSALGILLFLGGVFETVASPVAGWLFDTTGTYNVSFYVTATAFIIAGVCDIMAMVLLKRQTGRVMEEKEINVQTVAQFERNTPVNIQYSSTLEQTRM